jgi:hypothetical protein
MSTIKYTVTEGIHAIRYTWVDEDDNQVSPVHTDFSKALNFINGWHARWDRLVERYGTPNVDNMRRFNNAYVPMTRTGKPPIKLIRVIINIERQELTPAETEVCKTMLQVTS